MKKSCILSVASLFMAIAGGLALPASARDASERIAALKTILTQSRNNLRQYEWIETTVINVRGDEKSRKQERCFYGADGKVTKVLLNQTADDAPKFGLRRRIAEARKEEMTDYMKAAVAHSREVRHSGNPVPARTCRGWSSNPRTGKEGSSQVSVSRTFSGQEAVNAAGAAAAVVAAAGVNQSACICLYIS